MSQTRQPVHLTTIREIEKKWQERWNKEKIFEADVENRDKYFINFPFPYINGAPHLGHGYSLLKADCMARFQRLLNKNVLFPFAFHATGEPIVGMAKRVKAGDENQIKALKISGISENDLKKFEDPIFIVKYFRQRWTETVKALGLAIDWRRQFTTTTITPTFSKFVEWQYRTLHKKSYVIQGSHPVIWCPSDKNPTGDHDRLEGEGARVVDFIILKFKSIKHNAYFLPATLRPETVFGVTNMFLHPDAEYIKVTLNGEDVIISKSTLIKFQDQKFQVEDVQDLNIKTLIGSTCVNPVTGEKIPVLPGKFIDYEGSTGVVMSVPAHAPMDWIALQKLKDDVSSLESWGISADEIQSIKPISLIAVKGYGEFPAGEAIAEFKIKAMDDPKVKDATKLIYRREHNSGVLKEITKKYAGKTVQAVKDILIDDLIKENKAFILKEPAEKVVCRCGTRNHVKFLENQWFLAFSDPKWKKKAHKLIDEADMFPSEARVAFHNTVDWLENKACARRSGLGTPLPFDKDWIVETLSDSVIYMAYYIVSKYVNSGQFKESFANDDIYNYIFLGKGNLTTLSEQYGIEKDLLKKIKKEFNYFYPFNLRTSGKDLVNNHLTFMLMHHVAMFPEKHWPKGVAVNGYISIIKPGEDRGTKMSKSKGNFVTVDDAIEAFGADAIRIGFLTAGEGYKDAQLTIGDGEKYLKWIQTLYSMASESDFDEKTTSSDKWLISRVTKKINRVQVHFSRMETRSAFQVAYHDILQDIKWYLKRRGSKGPAYKYAVENMVRMLTPFCPHVVEEIWSKWGKPGLASTATFPEAKPSNIFEEVEKTEKFLNSFLDDLKNLKRFLKEKNKTEPNQIEVFVAPSWKYFIYNFAYEHGIKTIMKEMMTVPEIRKHGKEASKYMQQLIKAGVQPESSWTYDIEFSTLLQAKDYIEKEIGIPIKISSAEQENHSKANMAVPRRPGINFIM